MPPNENPRPGLVGTVTWPPGTATVLVVIEPGQDAIAIREAIADKLADERGVIVEEVWTHG